jgi:hypothetical protein
MKIRSIPCARYDPAPFVVIFNQRVPFRRSRNLTMTRSIHGSLTKDPPSVSTMVVILCLRLKSPVVAHLN